MKWIIKENKDVCIMNWLKPIKTTKVSIISFFSIIVVGKLIISALVVLLAINSVILIPINTVALLAINSVVLRTTNSVALLAINSVELGTTTSVDLSDNSVLISEIKVLRIFSVFEEVNFPISGKFDCDSNIVEGNDEEKENVESSVIIMSSSLHGL